MSKTDVTLPDAAGGDKSSPKPDQAWKALSITNEWVRYADSKTGVTLAFAGATATILFSLVRDHQPWSLLLVAATSIAATMLTLSVGAAALVLLPRLKPPVVAPADAARDGVEDEEVANVLYFGVVDSEYGKDRLTYLEALSRLTSDDARLTRQIASQIHANSCVAAVKFRFVNWAIRFELAAAATVAWVALLTATRW